MADYSDRWISCDDKGLAIRAYYFPWGTKHVQWSKLTRVRRVRMSLIRGKARIWGTGNFRYWASLDPGRPRKSTGYLLSLGHFVEPFITPADPEGFEAALREYAPSVVIEDSAAGRFT